MINENSFNKVRRAAAALILSAAAGAGTIAAASAAPAPAAAPDADVPSAVVRYGDLNLATEQGVKALYRRIAFVAKQVCPDGESRDLESLNRARTCQQEAIERAVVAVHNERLAALHAAASRHG